LDSPAYGKITEIFNSVEQRWILVTKFELGWVVR